MDSDQEELLQRRLSESVAERVEAQIKRKYGFIAFVAIAVASYFGWSISGQIKQVNTRIAAADEALGEIEVDLDPIKNALGDLESRAKTLDTLIDTVETETGEMTQLLTTAKKTQDDFIRRQSEIIARNIGATLDLRSPSSAGFFEEMKSFANENKFDALEVFLLVKLGQNRAYIGDHVGSRDYFNRAEEKARTLEGNIYLDVLINRARSEADSDQMNAALITLQLRAIDAVDPKDAKSLGRVYREIGETHHRFEHLAQAIEAYREAARQFEIADEFAAAADLYRTIGDLLSNPSGEFETDLEEAIAAYDKSIVAANYELDHFTLYYVHESLAEIYASAGDAIKQRDHICASARAAGQLPVLRDRIDVVRRLTGDPSQTFVGYCP